MLSLFSVMMESMPKLIKLKTNLVSHHFYGTRISIKFTGKTLENVTINHYITDCLSSVIYTVHPRGGKIRFGSSIKINASLGVNAKEHDMTN